MSSITQVGFELYVTGDDFDLTFLPPSPDCWEYGVHHRAWLPREIKCRCITQQSEAQHAKNNEFCPMAAMSTHKRLRVKMIS